MTRAELKALIESLTGEQLDKLLDAEGVFGGRSHRLFDDAWHAVNLCGDVWVATVASHVTAVLNGTARPPLEQLPPVRRAITEFA